jgi:hypothetical protein
MINCGQGESLIKKYYERGLEPDEKAAITEHIARCETCRKLYADIGAVEIALSESLKPVKVPAAIDDPSKYMERKDKPSVLLPEFIFRRKFALSFAFILLLFLGYFAAFYSAQREGAPGVIQDAAKPAEAAGYSIAALKDTVLFKTAADADAVIISGPPRSLSAGNIVITQGAGEAELFYDKNSSIKVRPESSLEIMNAGLRLKNGKIWVSYKKRGDKFSIITPAATVGIKGTVFTVEVDQNQQTIVDVEEGSVEMENEAGKIIMKSGERAVAKKGIAPSPANKNIDEDSYLKLE